MTAAKPPSQPSGEGSETAENVTYHRAAKAALPALVSTRARDLAAVAHHGQTDKIGEPYIGHPARVAKAVRDEGYSDEVEAVAWLHDVVEDTDVTLDGLAQQGFSPAVIAAVDAISKRKGESFADYYERVKANPMALVVKWHDVADNADPRRLAKVAPDTRERLTAKYERAKATLQAEASSPVGDDRG